MTDDTTHRWLWSDRSGPIEVRFLGHSPPPIEPLGVTLPPELDPASALLALERSDLTVAWLDQIHSTRALAAKPGLSGKGDALWTRAPGIALAIATADCVPVVVGGDSRLAAIHAGWRGIARGVVAAALAELTRSGSRDGSSAPAELTAWIGPSIGPCCYEVGLNVAEQVAAASSPTVIQQPDDGSTGKPHLNLAAAVEAQLGRAGITKIHRFSRCTRCNPGVLWSYRRDGARAGRNWTFAWLEPSPIATTLAALDP